ncbi:hypothetical protein [Paraburkholderia kirstenboschensis]|uniref:hypothetical protein n=1 Tax=Paraburkholderia kirstenboschensis TaxID=1245436 RepID=UPI00191AC167|nr:hypothetical protein [Paraburkholderia kirstenboschensis]
MSPITRRAEIEQQRAAAIRVPAGSACCPLPSGADDLWTITVLSSGLLIGFGSQEDSMTEHRTR